MHIKKIAAIRRRRSSHQRRVRTSSQKSVLDAIHPGAYEQQEEIDLADELSRILGTEIPLAVEEIRHAKICHTRECDGAQMEQTVREILGLR